MSLRYLVYLMPLVWLDGVARCGMGLIGMSLPWSQ